MKLSIATLVAVAATTEAFHASRIVGRAPQSPTRLSIVAGDEKASEKLEKTLASMPMEDPEFDRLVKSNFPGAISNRELATRVVGLLEEKGFAPENTLLATSVCADELARVLEE